MQPFRLYSSSPRTLALGAGMFLPLLAAQLLSREQYKAFLVRRRELIAAALNRFLGTGPSDGG